MARISLSHADQASLLKAVRRRLALTTTELAGLCRAHPRTFSDWSRGKYRMRYEALRMLLRRTGYQPQRRVSAIPEFSHVRRAARLGGLRRSQLYGNPGTVEGRRRGGLASVKRFRQHPELARALGFQLRKPIRRPRRSALLAEFIGVMLGDGCLSSRYQVGISFNSQTDRAYARHLQRLFQDLFELSAPMRLRTGTNGGTVVASSRALVEYLVAIGLVNGSKVAHQVDVPPWIWHAPAYWWACVRGLMDTDGSVYQYSHQVFGRIYKHVALCFTNRSRPLLSSVRRLLESFGFRPRQRRCQVYLHRREEVRRYARLIGSRNEKHLRKFQRYLSENPRANGRGARVVESDRLESD